MPFPPPPPAIVQTVEVVQPEEQVVVKVVMQDALRLGDFLSPATDPLVLFVLLDARWLRGGKLVEAVQEALLAELYGGPRWRDGNADGSAYVVLSFDSAVLDPGEVSAGHWRTTPGVWLYQVGNDAKVLPLGEGYVRSTGH